jgi:hypothetical protein
MCDRLLNSAQCIAKVFRTVRVQGLQAWGRPDSGGRQRCCPI